MDAFGRGVAVILAVVLVSLFPLKYLAYNQDRIQDNNIQLKTNDFVDTVKKEGFISIDMYENFLCQLNQTKQVYDIEIVHSKPLEGYDEISHRNVLTSLDQVSTHKSNNFVPAHSCNQVITSNTEANPIQTVKKESRFMSVSTSAFFPSYIPSYKYKYCTAGKGHPYYDSSLSECPICKAISGITISNPIVYYTGSGQGLTVTSSTGAQIRVYYNGSLTLPIAIGNYSASVNVVVNGVSWYVETTTFTIKKVVTSLEVYLTKATIYKGQAFPLNYFVARYNDGSGNTSGVGYTLSGFDSNIIGTQNVTVTYDGASTVKTITVLPNVTGLTVIPSSTTVYNGYEPSYNIIATYEDGTTKTITSGFTKIGFTQGAGTKTVTFYYTENGRSVSDTITIIVKRNISICPFGHTYELDDFNSDFGCPICKFTVSKITVAPQYVTVEQGSILPITVTATYLDGHTNVITFGWTCDFDNTKLGNQLVTVTYEGKSAYVSVAVVAEDITCTICNNTYKRNIDGSDPGCPICSKTVTGITASPETQVVPIESSLELEITATYRDGHSENVSGWTSNFNSFKTGRQTVTVYYQTLKTTVTVFVESPTETYCPICGTVYNPINHPNGCPYCANTVDSIEARLRTGGNLVQLGSDLNIAVIFIFKDGHRELAYNKYVVEGYEPNVLGNQNITVKYNEYSTTLNIEVVNTLSKTICENGHVYYLNEDGSDSECPLCSSALNQEETVKEYFSCIYTDEILKILYTDEIYRFNSGDFITVNVSLKTKTLLNKLQNIFMDIDKPNQVYRFGGMILGPCI